MALDCAGSAGVGVAAVVVAWSGSVECDFKADRLAIFRGAEDEMQVARVKAEDDFAGSRFEDSTFGAHLPRAAERPLIQRKPRLRSVGHARVLGEELGGGEVLGAFVTYIGFRRARVREIGRCFGTAGGDVDGAIGQGFRTVVF